MIQEKFIKNNKKVKVLTQDGYKDFSGVRSLYKKVLYVITFTDNTEIKITDNHILFLPDDKEISAKELMIGDQLKSKNGLKTISSITVSGNLVSGFKVFDLVDVKDVNTYYTNDVLSHNCNFNLSGETALEPEKLNFIRENYTKEPIAKEGPNQELWIWRYPETNKNYICLPRGEKILTNSGLKNIEEVTNQEKLYDINGNITDIVEIKKRNYDGDIYEIFLHTHFRSNKFTDEHPVYASKENKLFRNYKTNHDKYKFNERYRIFSFKYIESKYLKIGDWVKYPNIYKNNILNEKQILQKFDKYSEIGRTDFKIKDKNFILDKDFWWLVGLWLAEGWIENGYNNDKSILFGLNINETEYSKKISIIVNKLFGRKLTITSKPINNSMICKFNSKQLAMFLFDNFGKYAKNKAIPEWVKFLPNELKLNLIYGYYNGDGYLKNKSIPNKPHTVNFVSASLNLLEGIQDILFSLGIISSLQKITNGGIGFIKDRKVNISDKYSLDLGVFDTNKFLKLNNDIQYLNDIFYKRRIRYCYFSEDENYIYFKIKGIKKHQYNGDVYNFETTAHSFLVRGLVTHNCGVDVAKGDGSDFSAAQIICMETFEQVAEFKAMIDKERFGQLLCKWGMDYNGALLVIEDNYGERTIQKVIDLHYPNLFWMDTKFKGLIFDNLEKVKINKRSPGWHTTAKTRPLILENILKQLRDSVDDESGLGGITVRSTRLCSELETWGYYGGRLDHASGKHDDLIFAMAIAAFIQTVYSKITERENRDAVEFMKHFSNSGKLVDMNFGVYGTNTRSRNIINQYDVDGVDISWLLKDKPDEEK
jgi:hypothetical protein